MEQSANRVILRGSLYELPAFSHENHGKRFYRFTLEVERLSGTVDILPVLVSEEVLCAMDLSGGSMIEVSGQIRSFNSRAATGRRLVVSVYAESLTACEGEPHNEVYLAGTLCKEPVHRKTPLGREIADLMVKVPRPYSGVDYIPCVVWGRCARFCAHLGRGTMLEATGRLQSREYVKVLDGVQETRTAYELSIGKLTVL